MWRERRTGWRQATWDQRPGLAPGCLILLALMTLACSGTEKAEPYTRQASLTGDRGLELHDSEVLPVGQRSVRGPHNAPVTVTVVGDPSRGSYVRLYQQMEQFRGKHPKKIRLVMQPGYPLSAPGRAAYAVMLAAREQGKFWQVHDELMRWRGLWAQAGASPAMVVLPRAGELELDVERFRRSLNSPEFEERMRKECSAGERLRLREGALLNGMHVGKEPLEEQLKSAETLLAELRKGGVSRLDLYRDAVKQNLGKQPLPGGFVDSDTVPILDAPMKGRADALVTVVVFSDLQCPFCLKLHRTLEEIFKERDDLRLVFKNKPLPFHKEARMMARAAYAGWQQGKFWPLSDRIFEKQREFRRGRGEEIVTELAAELGLDRSIFARDRESQEARKWIARDDKLANKLGVRGTPTMFINGERQVGTKPKSALNKLLDEAREEASRALARGVPAAQLYRKQVASRYKAR